MKKLQEQLRNWWRSIYKLDELGKLTGIVSAVLLVLSAVFGSFLVFYFGMAGLIFFVYRYCSRQHYSRIEENNLYLRYCKLWKVKYENRKTAKVFLCKRCGTFIRVPKKKGKIEITCKVCGEKTIRRT